AFPQLRENKSEEGAKEASEKSADATPAGADKPAASSQVAAGPTSTETKVTPEAAREFQEFQEWKKEQQAFREFQEWKKQQGQ
ncbi:MAG: hypothetical protein JRE72_08280, partial [Deltaproteobacteria bacterium]|nr:hypothetical protein [Deltaproteobacteria bacterium]